MSEKHPLISYREAHGLSQEQLARRLGVSPAALSRWEQRKRQPRGAVLKTVAEVTGISAARILGLAEVA